MRENSIKSQGEIEAEKVRRMTSEPIRPLILKMAVPTVISMLVTSLYNMVDTFFVGQVGTAATAGVGLIFPIMTVFQAFGFFFGQGSGSYISRSLGAGDVENSEKMAAVGAYCSVIFGVIILALGMIFNHGVLALLGAKEGLVNGETIAYAKDYLMIILLAAPFMCLSCVLNNILRFQGDAMFAMIGIVSGAVLNCVLDPIFIFALHMEVKGAAIATAIGQAVGCMILMAGIIRSDSIKIRLKNFKPKALYIKNIFIGGTPSLLRQSMTSVSVMCLNYAAAKAVSVAMADASIAAFSIVTKVMNMAFFALLGFGQGFQPVCGFNYGARRYDRVRKGFTFCLTAGFCFLLVMSVLLFIFAGDLVAVFRDDPNVIAIGTIAMRMQCITFSFMAIMSITNTTYQTLGKVVGATLLATIRQGLVLIPAVLILPLLFTDPIWGVYLAQPVADLAATAVAVPLAVKMYKELR